MGAIFPWFGSKRLVAADVWQRLGDVGNLVIPFAGSAEILFNRPSNHKVRIETINDKDRFVANFWRSVAQAPDEVAHYATWPTVEADLHARHRWLTTKGIKRLAPIEDDPEFFDPQVAGWWVWGICQWIGRGWCYAAEEGAVPQNKSRLNLSRRGEGVLASSRQIPVLSASSPKGIIKSDGIHSAIREVARRLLHVRVCSGDWTRVTGPSVTYKNSCTSLTAVFLDPPYGFDVRTKRLYRIDEDVAVAAREYALSVGERPDMRVALCGYLQEHDRHMPEGWERFVWKQGQGYGKERKDECIWFSPHCLPPTSDAHQLSILI